MNSFFTKNKILIWVVLLLIILNISVIATILYKRHVQRKFIERPPAEMYYRGPRPGIYLRDELKMNDKQYAKLMDARMKYQERARSINLQLIEKKRAYWDELMKEKPDSLIILDFCDSIGNMHARLMRETGTYYNEIRQLCNDNQLGRLNTFFMSAMEIDNRPMVQNRGRNIFNRPVNRGRNFRNER